MDLIFKRFDRYATWIESNIFLISDEMQLIDNAKHLNTDFSNSLIINNYCTVEYKIIDIKGIENISDFIFITPNSLSIKIKNRN
jgi:hypothetical protein